jgi:uncharacterized protein YkwD
MAGTGLRPARSRAIWASLVIATALVMNSAVSGTAVTAAAAGTAGSGCAHANDAPSEATSKEFRAAIRCLITKERRRRDLPAFKSHGGLDSVAQRHTRVMLKKDCFAHVCTGEKSLAQRIEAAGYPRPGDTYGFAESTGYAGTPRAMLNGEGGWMKQRYHRRNILSSRFLHIGVGAGRGIPVKGAADSAGVTYTVIFAWRERR